MQPPPGLTDIPEIKEEIQTFPSFPPFLQQLDQSAQPTPQAQQQPYQIPNFRPPYPLIKPYSIHNMQKMGIHYQLQTQTLESLDLDIKLPKDEDSKSDHGKSPTLNKSDCFFNQVNFNFNNQMCYLEPSLNNLTITSDGFICDTQCNDLLGIWDTDMKLVRYFKGLVENIQSIQMISLLGNKLLVGFFTQLMIIDLTEGKKQIIWDGSISFDFLCVTNHYQPRLFAVKNGLFYVWKMKTVVGSGTKEAIFNNSIFLSDGYIGPKPNDYLDLKKIKETSFGGCDNILVLDNGIVLAKNNKLGEVFSVDFDNDTIKELQQTQGSSVLQWTALAWDLVAMGRQQSIIIIQFTNQIGQIHQIIKTGNDDITHGIVSLQFNRIGAITNKAVVKVYDLKNGKCIQSYQNIKLKQSSGLYNLKVVSNDVLVTTSYENKEFSLHRMTQTESAINFDAYFVYKARVKTVLHCILNDKYIAVVQKSGLFFGGQVDFHLEIEIYNLKNEDENFQKRKVIEKSQIQLHTLVFSEGEVEIKKEKEPEKEELKEKEKEDSKEGEEESKEESKIESSDESFESKQDEIDIVKGPCLMFILKKDEQSSQLVKWYFSLNQTQLTELNVEKYLSAKMYNFHRLAFSYNYQKTSETENQKEFNLFAPRSKKSTQPEATDQQISGLSVYDFEIVEKLRVQFSQPFDCQIFGMPNKDLIYYLNSKNQIEAYNLETKGIVQKADCRPSIIKEMYFEEKLIFLYAQGEWIVRDLKLGLVEKKKSDKHIPKRILFVGENQCMIHHYNQLSLWNMKENKVETIQVDFTLSDFCLLNQTQLLAIGDSAMKTLKIK